MTDAGGALVTRTIAWDDGIEEILGYTAGAQTSRRLTDTGNVQPWDLIQITFDVATGLIASRTTDFGDGLQVVEGYTNGQLTTRTTTDTGGTKAWASAGRCHGGRDLQDRDL